MDRRQFLVSAVGLAIAPRSPASIAAPKRIVLVTADLESHVVVVDAASGHVVQRIATRSSPRSIEAVGTRAVVCHSEIGVVSVLDAQARAVQHELEGFGEPRYAAGHPDGRHAYVTDAERGEVVLLDLVRGRILVREAVGDRARHITIDPHARRLWVALGSKAEEIAVLDIARVRPRLVRRFAPPQLAHDVGFAPDGRHAWVTAGEARELTVYDLRTGSVVARPSAGWAPQHVTFSADRAFVTSGWSGSLHVHDHAGRLLRSAPVPVGSYNVQEAHGLVVTPALGRGYLTTVSLAGHTLRSVKVARSSHDACVVRF